MELDFERWYLREHPRVLAACAALAGNIDAANDAADEAFVRALERWPLVSQMASPGGWVQVVALNQLRRVLRRRRRERLLFARRPSSVNGDPPGLTPDPDLWAAVAALPSRQRAVVVLRYVQDLPQAAIGEVMGISRGTVASMLSGAQARLRLVLAESLTPNEAQMTKETFHD
jgi:DNA-directed RNA polymerase specialized sigma24 family protein